MTSAKAAGRPRDQTKSNTEDFCRVTPATPTPYLIRVRAGSVLFGCVGFEGPRIERKSQQSFLNVVRVLSRRGVGLLSWEQELHFALP